MKKSLTKQEILRSKKSIAELFDCAVRSSSGAQARNTPNAHKRRTLSKKLAPSLFKDLSTGTVDNIGNQSQQSSLTGQNLLAEKAAQFDKSPNTRLGQSPSSVPLFTEVDSALWSIFSQSIRQRCDAGVLAGQTQFAGLKLLFVAKPAQEAELRQYVFF